jgi:hypothetical protein
MSDFDIKYAIAESTATARMSTPQRIHCFQGASAPGSGAAPLFFPDDPRKKNIEGGESDAHNRQAVINVRKNPPLNNGAQKRRPDGNGKINIIFQRNPRAPGGAYSEMRTRRLV